jgi:hypothetical protein
MSHQFCVKCGEKNTYEASPPNFCCGCGQPFNKSVATPKAVDQNEEVTSEATLNIDKTKLAEGWVAQVNSVERNTLGDLYKNPSPRGNNIARPRPKSLGENAAEATRQACAPVRSTKEVGVDKS